MNSLKTWLVQDGARPHRTSDVSTFLKEYFDDRVIAVDNHNERGEGMDSSDLNLCDFFLWDPLKNGNVSKKFYHDYRPSTDFLGLLGNYSNKDFGEYRS